MADDPLIGQQLDEYRIEALLGQGGMAQVYRSFDTRLERWVAIKVIEASFQSDADYKVRFAREARAIAQLEHPHIVSVYRYGEANGVLYMAMRYIEGLAFDRILTTYHQEGDFIPVAEARQIIQQICQALDYAHRRKVIHRDIKPGNIIIDKQGNAYLTDFGLVLLTDVGTRGEIFGTPHYIAPEQAISSARVVPQSDLYAIGVILFEIFTGQVPFDADSGMDVAMMHMTEPPPSLRQFRPDLSPEVEAVILKALEKEPTDRYPTGAALVEALDQALKARTKVALPLPAAEKSIFQRVVVDLAERPLPLMPMGVTPPPPAVLPEPAKRPEGSLAASAAGIASPKVAAGPQGRSLLVAGLGMGAILIAGFLVLLLGVGLFLLLRNNKPDEATQATITATLAPSAVAETPPVASNGGAMATTTPPSATAEEPATAKSQPQLLAHNVNDFGTGKWLYLWAPPDAGNWQPLQYEDGDFGDCWYSREIDEAYVRICDDSGHPGNEAEVAWYWQSQSSGPIEVRLSVAKEDADGGDGVEIAIYHNFLNTLQTKGQPLFQRDVEGRDEKGFTEFLQIEQIQPQESLMFVLRRKDNPTHDNTAVNIQICLYSCPPNN